MKTRSIILVLILALAGGVAAHAQSLGATQITLKLDGQAFGGVLVPPSGALAGYTWTLPAQSGTLALSSVGGWTIGGNSLSATGLLGSLSAHDVTLIAGGNTATNERLTLLNGEDAVLLPTETALRFGDAAGGQYTALVSPPVLTGGSGTGNVTLILPEGLPGGPDVRIQVKTVNAVSGVVELEYSNPNTTGSIGFKGNTVASCNGSNATTVPVTGMTLEVESNAIYSFEAIVEVDGANSNADVTFGTPAGDAQDATIDILYRLFQLSGNGNPPGGLNEDSFTVLTAGETYILKGYIQTGVLATSPQTVQLRVRRQGGGTQTCITAKSAVQLITE